MTDRTKWYRLYHGIPFDATLAVVAHRASLKRAEVLALWIALLDHASQSSPRGSIGGADLERIALALDVPFPSVLPAIDVFIEKGMITNQKEIAGWRRSQMTSTARVRAHRHRRRVQDVQSSRNNNARHERLLSKGDRRRSKTSALYNGRLSGDVE